jgi:hypothetical protein
LKLPSFCAPDRHKKQNHTSLARGRARFARVQSEHCFQRVRIGAGRFSLRAVRIIFPVPSAPVCAQQSEQYSRRSRISAPVLTAGGSHHFPFPLLPCAHSRSGRPRPKSGDQNSANSPRLGPRCGLVRTSEVRRLTRTLA